MAFFLIVVSKGNSGRDYAAAYGRSKSEEGYMTEAGARKAAATFKIAKSVVVAQFADLRAARSYAAEVTELINA